MPTDTTELWWTLAIGTTIFLSLGIGIISLVLYAQRRFIAAQEEKLSILTDSEKRFRSIVEDSPVPTTVTRNGVIIYCNAAVLRLLKTPFANDVLGKPFSSFLHPGVLQGVREQVNLLVEFNKSLPSTELSILRSDNKVIKAEVAAIPITYDSGAGALVVIHDITEAKNAEEILRNIPGKILDAEEAVRKRFARELHDGVNQILFNVKGQLEILEMKMTPEFAGGRKDLSSILDPLKTAMKEIQRISRNLRPAILDDLGLSAAINSMVDEFSTRTHVRVMVKGFTDQRLAPEIELAFFRIIQEALHNIEKYAMATQVIIECTCDEAFFQVTITDNGKGFVKGGNSNLSGSGVGLTTMRERAQLLGGSTTIVPELGKGTKITVIVPRELPHVAVMPEEELSALLPQ